MYVIALNYGVEGRACIKHTNATSHTMNVITLDVTDSQKGTCLSDCRCTHKRPVNFGVANCNSSWREGTAARTVVVISGGDEWKTGTDTGGLDAAFFDSDIAIREVECGRDSFFGNGCAGTWLATPVIERKRRAAKAFGCKTGSRSSELPASIRHHGWRDWGWILWTWITGVWGSGCARATVTCR